MKSLQKGRHHALQALSPLVPQYICVRCYYCLYSEMREWTLREVVIFLYPQSHDPSRLLYSSGSYGSLLSLSFSSQTLL